MIAIKKIIQIPNKGFDDLDAYELASMLEADSALSPQGNEDFASCALDEFLHGASLARPDLIAIRHLTLENIYSPVPGQRHAEVNREFLLQLAERLRRDGRFWAR